MVEYPRLSNLPSAIFYDVLFGAGYSFIFKSNYKITITAFSVWTIADTLLFAVINPLSGGDGKKRSLVVFTATSTLVSATAVIGLRHFKIIGTLGTVFYTSINTILLLSRVFGICFDDLEPQN
jgi:hypothetical protein